MNFFYLFVLAPYVKVYLLDGKTCVEKQRTRTTRRTLDPLIQQTLLFKENYRDKVLQVKVDLKKIFKKKIFFFYRLVFGVIMENWIEKFLWVYVK